MKDGKFSLDQILNLFRGRSEIAELYKGQLDEKREELSTTRKQLKVARRTYRKDGITQEQLLSTQEAYENAQQAFNHARSEYITETVSPIEFLIPGLGIRRSFQIEPKHEDRLVERMQSEHGLPIHPFALAYGIPIVSTGTILTYVTVAAMVQEIL